MSKNELVARLHEFAEAQHGVVALHQAKAIVPEGIYKREFVSNRWERIERSVYRVCGSPYTPAAMAMVWLLRAGPGATVSHYSAMALWQVPSQSLLPLHVLRMRASNGVNLRDDRITVHRVRAMPADHVTTFDGFPITTPSRTIVDMAAIEPEARVSRWLDRLWSKQLVSYRSVRDVVERQKQRGRTGIPLMRKLLEERGPFYVAPQSGLESRLSSVLERANLPIVERQANVGGDVWLARTDFRVRGTPILIEVQSDLFHAALTRRDDDARRFAALQRAGFVVVEVAERDVWENPELIVWNVARIHDQRSA